MESALYPIQNKYRFNTLMNGTWQFETDLNSVGLDEGWNKQLPNPEEMPVPGTFAELTTKRDRKYYTGNFWYQKDFFIPSFLKKKELYIRFGSVLIVRKYLLMEMKSVNMKVVFYHFK